VGEGTLVIGGPTGVRGEVKLPGREFAEFPLVVRNWKAGHHTLEFVSSEGAKARCPVKVVPVRRTVVVFDGARCTVGYRD
jgi:hypothetical protein